MFEFVGDGLGRIFSLNGFLNSQSLLFIFALLTLVVPALLVKAHYRELASNGVGSSLLTTLMIYYMNLFFVPIAYVVPDSVSQLYGLLGIPKLSETFWSGIPWWGLAIVGVLAFDFADYWSHRVMHMRWLWPIHAIHHSDDHVSGLTTYRVHFLERSVMMCSYILLLSWLGLPKEAIGVGAALVTLHNMYVHIDIDWGHGPFKYLLASPRFHRWHHADTPELYGKNLANIFPFYDVMFGTYHVPGACAAPMGAKGVPTSDPVKLMAYPFVQWAAMVRRRMLRIKGNFGAQRRI